MSRAGFYVWSKRPPSRRARTDAALTQRIAEIHEGVDGIYGAPRIHAELADEDGIRVGRERVARLMRKAGIEGVSRRRFRVGTTSPGGEAPAAPDLVERDFTAERPNQLWFADITYVPTWQAGSTGGRRLQPLLRRLVDARRSQGRPRLRRPRHGRHAPPAGR